MEGKGRWKDRGGQTSLPIPAAQNPSKPLRKAKRDGTEGKDDLGNFASILRILSK